MKALIVDDELHLIHTIEMLVPWQQLGIDKVFAATTVSEAKKLLKEEKPELAFFDIVIGNEYGTDLMNYVVEEQIPVKVLAISGYSNFEYVRNMYFNYHAKIKRLIKEGHLIDYEFLDEYRGIRPVLLLYFDNNRPMPIREYKWDEYLPLLNNINNT